MSTVDQQPSFLHDPSSKVGFERRQATSDSEIATRILHRAVGHLLWERERGQYLDLAVNGASIEILCNAAQALAKADRRHSMRTDTLAWLRGVLQPSKR